VIMLLRTLLVLAMSNLLAAPASKAAEFGIDAQTGQIVIKSLAGFDACVLDLAEIPACLEALRQHASKHPNDAFQAAKRALRHYPAWTALPFFEIAFRKRATDAQCEDEDVLRAVTEGLSRPDSDTASIDLARGLAAGKCWEALEAGLIEAAGTDAARLKANACAVLASKALTVAACDAISPDLTNRDPTNRDPANRPAAPPPK